MMEDEIRETESTNAMFRDYRYPTNNASFTAETLKPGDNDEMNNGLNDLESFTWRAYPHPFTDRIIFKYISADTHYELINTMGQTLWSGKQIEQQDFSALKADLYFLKINLKKSIYRIKLIKH